MPKMCGMFKHLLVDGVHVTNEKHISFMHKTNRDFRPEDKICLVCRTTMEYMYELKLKRAKDLKRSRGNTISSVSSTDSIDTMVDQTPQHRKLMSKGNGSSSLQTVNFEILPSLLDDSVFIGTQENVHPTGSDNSARTPIVEIRGLVTASTAVTNQPSKVSLGRRQISFNDELSTIRPNASTVTAKLKNMSNRPVASPTIYTDDAENFAHSLNVRLSQQPTTSAAARAEVSPKIHTHDADSFAHSINVRLSQQPTTSAAARAKAIHKSTPKSRDLREYLTPLRANPEGAKTTRTPLVSILTSPTARDTPAINTEQVSTSSRQRPVTVHHVGDDDDTTTYGSDDDARSLNYYDPNVRCPQYQPIPKRREFHNDNPIVMDIYLKGLRGG